MIEDILNMTRSWEKNAPSAKAEIEQLLTKANFNIDKEYVAFISEYNGAQGAVSETEFVLLWEIKHILELNPYYDDIEECENLMFFGTNGSNTGYAFNKTDGSIVSIDFLEIGNEKPKKLGNNFTEFLQRLYNE